MKNKTQVLSATAGSAGGAQAPAADFVVTFLIEEKTCLNTGKKENSLSFSAPGATAIDWGDGCVDQVNDNDEFPEHIYAESGVYDVRITGDIDRFCYFPVKQLIDVKQWGRSQWENVYAMFSDCVNMTMSAKDAPDLSKANNLEDMFSSCAKFNSHIGHWDVSRVTNMSGMFRGASAFNQALNGWDVSNVWSMKMMFFKAKKFNQSLDKWRVGGVRHMESMFSGATAFNQALASWNVFSAKTDYNGLRNMFLNTDFHQDLTTWARKMPGWDKTINGRTFYDPTEHFIFGENGHTLNQYIDNYEEREAKMESDLFRQTLT